MDEHFDEEKCNLAPDLPDLSIFIHFALHEMGDIVDKASKMGFGFDKSGEVWLHWIRSVFEWAGPGTKIDDMLVVKKQFAKLVTIIFNHVNADIATDDTSESSLEDKNPSDFAKAVVAIGGSIGADGKPNFPPNKQITLDPWLRPRSAKFNRWKAFDDSKYHVVSDEETELAMAIENSLQLQEPCETIEID